MTVVTLTRYEISMAAHVGCQRTLDHFSMGRPDTALAPISGRWENDIQGAAAECAFAKLTGLYWDGSVNTFKNGGDVGSIQVRSTPRSDGCLIIRDGDKDADIFVLMTGQIPRFTYRGRVIGKDGKQEAWIRDPHEKLPAYFIPQSALTKKL